VDAVDERAASFRSMSSMSARERDAALASGLLALEISDWIDARFNLPLIDILTFDHQQDPSAAARALRQYWAIGEKPIGHFVKLIESKGVRVFALAENTRTVDAFSYWRNGIPYMFLNTIKTAERSRFDAAHELGHLVLHRHGGPSGREAEYQANMFASAFLMPEADVVAKVPYVTKLSDLIIEKRRWGVSLAALAFRLHKLKRITDWQYRSYCIQIERDHGNSEPNALLREKSAVWQMVLTELWKDGITRHSIADELKLPHEEVDTLLFGLMGEHTVPTAKRKPQLRSV